MFRRRKPECDEEHFIQLVPSSSTAKPLARHPLPADRAACVERAQQLVDRSYASWPTQPVDRLLSEAQVWATLALAYPPGGPEE